MARIRYQVFISSTFTDLIDERRAVAAEILAAGHIPAGMEDFPATDERGWKTIKKTIDLCDYYVLLLAGRYGEIDKAIDMSWTDREYRYAREEKKLKILAFIREDSAIKLDKFEKEEEGRKRRDEFVDVVKQAHLYKAWMEKDDLVGKVSQALSHAINDDEDEGTLPPGWVRGTELPLAATADEIARLSKENADLRASVAKSPLHSVLAGIEVGTLMQVRVPARNGGQLREQLSFVAIDENENAIKMLTTGDKSAPRSFPLDKVDTVFKAPNGWQLTFTPYQ